uniref:Uncharacterized protein n=1 Tax=Oncorhynchus mykiss TaxID=8022 RepID=A0A8L0DJ32_ONCMY
MIMYSRGFNDDCLTSGHMYNSVSCTFTDASHGVAMDRGLVVKHLKSQDPSGISRQLESDEGLEALTHKTYKGKGAISRRKRNILFPSGVKLCSQETVDQAIENHLKYFHQRGFYPETKGVYLQPRRVPQKVLLWGQPKNPFRF